MQIVTAQMAEPKLDWRALTEALAAGHRLPRAEVGDTFLSRSPDTLLSRAAWIDGLGALVKTATIFPGNPAQGQPAINGGVCLYSDRNGTLEALFDFHLLTKWKTAGDSLLAALRLAPPRVERILILGSGTVAASMVEAYGAGFPDAQIAIWSRSGTNAEALAAQYPGTKAVTDLPEATAAADIICTATMSSTPVLQGAWLSPGTHLDLIGAYKADMREVDDTALTRARLFCDARATVVGHIGEYTIPMEAGVIGEEDLVADYYALDQFRRQSVEEITICKNGGGAHLDLMTARHIMDRLSQ